LRLYQLDSSDKEPGRIVARYPGVFALNSTVALDPIEDRFAASDATGNLWIWALDGDGTGPERVLAAPGSPMSTTFSPDGSRLAYASGSYGARLWDLHGPVAAEPLQFEVEGPQLRDVAFSPDGRWLLTSGGAYQLAMWPLSGRFGRILHGHEGGIAFIAFTPDGSHLVTQGGGDGKVLMWDLSGGAGIEPTVLFENTRQWGWGLAMDPKGRFVIISDLAGTYRVPLDGGPPETLEDFPRMDPRLCPEGRLVAANIWREGPTATMVVMDLETRERWEFDPPGDGPVDSYSFDPQGRLLMTRGGVLSRSTGSTDSTEALLEEGASGWAFALADGRLVLHDGVTLHIHNLEDGSQAPLAKAHQNPSAILMNPPDSVCVTGHREGEIRVGRHFDENPHLLLGHEGPITDIWISPDHRWLATLGGDDGFRLWPMPDLSKPPLHTLPHDELLATLEAQTNLRAVPDNGNYTGYRIEPDFTAYRGWAEVPEW
jgi:WD40 repeat protein